MDDAERASRNDIVVDLTGVPPETAYAWGIEAGTFMNDAQAGVAEGIHVFNAGNMGMIKMIAAEHRLRLTLLGSEDEFVRCAVESGLAVIRGGKT